MSNATRESDLGVVSNVHEYVEHSYKTISSETRLYVNAMLGLTTSGYLSKYDDTASLAFAGVVRHREGNPLLPAGTQGADALKLQVHQPKFIELTITSVAVTDIGKTVYALYDNEGTLSAAATTYANVIGVVEAVITTNVALVRPYYGFKATNQELNASKVLAATGAQSLTKWDINKTIIAPNTAAYTVTLPAIADTQAGDRLFFVKTTSDAHAVTLDGNASETIDGSTTLATIDAQFDAATLVSTGSAWVVLNRDIA